MPLRKEKTATEGTFFNGKSALPFINEKAFDSLVFHLVQAVQPEDYQNLENRLSNETIELPSQWRKYKEVEPCQLIFCVETGLLIWIQGILLKYAVDMGLFGTSLFEPRYVKGHTVHTELARFEDIFSEGHIWRKFIFLVVENRFPCCIGYLGFD